MKITLAGASGLIGQSLASTLLQAGHDISRLVRHPPTQSSELQWNPEEGVLDPGHLDNTDAVICLSGEGIANGRWNASKKQRILQSRLQTASLISKTLNACTSPPKTFICASAIGYYGTNHGDDTINESNPPGDDYLAQVCQDWERAATSESTPNTRIIHLRFGIVLSPHGGALAKMLTPFRMGLGGKLSSGQQWMSWISITDALRAILFTLENDQLKGPINFTAPQPVRNIQFTRALAQSLHKIALFPIPGFIIKTALGEMGETLLLNGARVTPEKLLECGFEFQHPTIDLAFKDLL